MTALTELLRTGWHGDVWLQYCGFLDITLDEFMTIQERLLLEQLDLVNRSPWGKLFLDGIQPATVDEFRRLVPLTHYEDYAAYLDARREDLLPAPPITWAHTSGWSGFYKWVPFTQQMYTQAGVRILAALILAMARRRGDVRLRQEDVLVYNLPPRPYASGLALFSFREQFPFRFIPPAEMAESLSFQERLELSFQMAMAARVDLIGSITPVLIKVSEGLASGAHATRLARYWLNPRALARLARATLRSRLARRPMLPRDLWSVKGVICGGTETALYKETIAEAWGTVPYEVYAATEAGVTAAVQAWDKKGLYFFPDAVFIEFIPEAEWVRNRYDPTYIPATVLLDEVEEGQRYELVLTSFAGGPFLRYRMADLVRVVSLRDDDTGIKLPSVALTGRSNALIDLAGFSGLFDESMIGRAVHDAGFPYADWSARAEPGPQGPLLHIYLELKTYVGVEDVQARIHENLKALNPSYADPETMAETHAVRVTLLRPGVFAAYGVERQATGADLAHLKPPRMNAGDVIIRDLLRLAGRGAERGL